MSHGRWELGVMEGGKCVSSTDVSIQENSDSTFTTHKSVELKLRSRDFAMNPHSYGPTVPKHLLAMTQNNNCLTARR